jgi:hypothetical protein
MPGFYTVTCTIKAHFFGSTEIEVAVRSFEGFENYVTLDFSADHGPGTTVDDIIPLNKTLWVPKNKTAKTDVTLVLSGPSPRTATFFANSSSASCDVEVSQTSDKDARDDEERGAEGMQPNLGRG